MTRKEYPPRSPSEPTSCIIEAYTAGEERRAHVRARLREIRPRIFAAIPFYLREISGPEVPWQSPEPGRRAIETTSPITGFDKAHSVLAWWCTQAFALNRQL
jgi:hypothetical protein